MPPRPNSPAMRYRPANTVPGRKRPSSTLLAALRRGTPAAPLPSTTVSAEVASSGAAQEAQNRLSSAQSRVQAGHRTIRVEHLSAPERGRAGAEERLPSFARTWSFCILLVTFMGMSPGGARESSPWREPWEQTRTARSPGGAKEPFHGDSPIAGHEGPCYAPTGLARLWAGPTGLTPWAIFASSLFGVGSDESNVGDADGI